MADNGVMTPWSSRNPEKTRTVTSSPNPSPADPGGPTRLGEKIPPGSIHTAHLYEYPNLAPQATENAGPEGPSANATMLPAVGKGIRKTGRV